MPNLELDPVTTGSLGDTLYALWPLTTRIVISATTTATPASPSDGHAYVVPASGVTGAWAGSEKKIAIYDGGGAVWRYLTAVDQWTVRAQDDDKEYGFDGSVWAEIVGGGSNYYDVEVGFDVTPTSDEVVTTRALAREVTFPADFSGSIGSIATNPTSTMVLLVKDDGTEIGQVSISTSGAFTFTTSSGTAKTVAAGSILTFVGPTTADASAAGCVVTLLGTA